MIYKNEVQWYIWLIVLFQLNFVYGIIMTCLQTCDAQYLMSWDLPL